VKRRAAVTLALIATLALPASASAAKGKDKGKDVTVMTRNVFLGADLGPAINASDIPTAIDGAGEIWNEVVTTNFNERAIPLAKEIKRAKPDLVGLQEVANWQTQTPSDGGGPPITNGTPASDTAYDFLALLTARLGSKYEVVGVQEEFAAELPADTDQNDATGSPFGADLDARLTMRDVILARKGTKTKRLEMDHYVNRFETNVGGIPVAADRGWLSVDANVDGAKFRFFNTHLEAFGDPSIRAAQAQELGHDEAAQHRPAGARPRPRRPARLLGVQEGEVQGQRGGAELLLPGHVRWHVRVHAHRRPHPDEAGGEDDRLVRDRERPRRADAVGSVAVRPRRRGEHAQVQVARGRG
jgi:endonuclease/exonuclease/phosphatase family metal-dependent hydrolase